MEDARLHKEGKSTVEQAVCELDESRWSVISFERCEGGGLTYGEAVELLKKLNGRNVAGLCIVTDEAGERVKA